MEAGARKPGGKLGGRPTREQAAAIDAQVLDGARSVFCRKGVANSSVEEIALELGVSKHTIYRRYPNKAALLDAVVARDIGRFRQALSSAAAEGTGPLDALRRAALRYVEIGSSRDYAAFYLSVSAEAALSPTLRARLAAWSGEALAPLVEAVASAQAAGALRPGDPAGACGILVDLLEGVNNRIRLGDGPPADPSLLQRLFDERWTVFTAALG
ncbi:TetR/AcrR family transcriptional regulator [Azospirillum rugosum]|uniref:AcrR family transcriptional regulator n=1 Tax=Azospirillum rugosum TaxID=416170 RepID=A0ABS4SW43_9PROT|nr:TetR/AcrR family transcriptional regulator [Azospirillum rugosum]MBP2296167.1 AcrR family transcriptional regulator [Azospirillum rugosum]MDQ0527148.1 AcrR family transcriptional regulator [Azospirillum rugosum]